MEGIKKQISCAQKMRYKQRMENDLPQTPPQQQLRKKNYILLWILVALIALLYALSYVKFGMAVHQ